MELGSLSLCFVLKATGLSSWNPQVLNRKMLAAKAFDL
jgi:hypothetical protein